MHNIMPSTIRTYTCVYAHNHSLYIMRTCDEYAQTWHEIVWYKLT